MVCKQEVACLNVINGHDSLSVQKVGYQRNGSWILRELSYAFPLRKVTLLTGPSGCGKTTLLRIIAGLETPDSGEIFCGGTLFSAPGRIMSPWQRGVDMLFQSDALWPNQTIRQQIEWVSSRRSATDALCPFAEMVEELGIVDLLDRRPAGLSGGEARRCQLARVLAGRPGIILLDEPLAGQDKETAAKTAALLGKLLSNSATTAIIVSHETELFASYSWSAVSLNDLNQAE